MRLTDIDFTGFTEAVIGSAALVVFIAAVYFIGDIAIFMKGIFL